MKVIIEAQHAVGLPQPRGIGYYTIDIIHALLNRKKYDYALSFFDCGREMGNYQRAENYFGKYSVPFHECNELDYRIASRDDSVFLSKSYNEYIGADADVFHFTDFVSIPTNIKGRSVCTVHDLNWLAHREGCSDFARSILNFGFERLKKTKPFIITDSNYSKYELLEYSSLNSERVFIVPLAVNDGIIYPDISGKHILSELGVCDNYVLFIGIFETKKKYS